MTSKEFDLIFKKKLEIFDDEMMKLGFKRNKNGLKYVRIIDNTKQIIEFVRHFNPKYMNNKMCHFNPIIQIENKIITEMLMRMVESMNELGGEPSIVLMNPISCLDDSVNTTEWSITSIDEIESILLQILFFIKTKVILFLDNYSSPEGFIQGYLKNDKKLILLEKTILVISACFLIQNDTEGAKKILNEKFNTIGHIKRHWKSFEYVNSK